MAVTQRARRLRYDNIAAGSATGNERTVRGDTVTVNELYGGGTCTSTSTGDTNRSNIAVGASVSDGADPDNMGNGAGGTTDPTDENTGSSNTAGFATNP